MPNIGLIVLLFGNVDCFRLALIKIWLQEKLRVHRLPYGNELRFAALRAISPEDFLKEL